MQARTRSKASKKMCSLSEEEDTYISCSEESEYSQSEVQNSNSQLSKTLSIAFNPKQLTCRQNERLRLSRFVKSCCHGDGKQGSRVLYISGVPGVGKTVLTKQIIRKVRKTINSRKVSLRYFNAMALPHPHRIYNAIYSQMYDKEKKTIKFPALTLQKSFQQDPRIKILVIDQIDYLITKDQNVLYTLFQWCNMPSTKLSLIVIANTMDFPERLLPKVASRMGSNRMVFKPYSQKEVQIIIEERLSKSDRFTKDAVMYACKRLSSYTSDVRKILNVLLSCLNEKKEGKIDIDDVSRNWRSVSAKDGNFWQETLPQFYKDLLSALKQEGGVAWSSKILYRMKVHQKYSQGEILAGMEELQELAIIKLKQKKNGCGWELQATLIKL